MPGQKLEEAVRYARDLTPQESLALASAFIDRIFDVFVRTEHGSDHGKKPDDAVTRVVNFEAAVRDVHGGLPDWVVRKSIELRLKRLPLKWKITLRCESGHEQILHAENMTAQMVRDYAGLIDGTSPMYVHPPRDGELTAIGRCLICKKPFTATVEAEE